MLRNSSKRLQNASCPGLTVTMEDVSVVMCLDISCGAKLTVAPASAKAIA